MQCDYICTVIIFVGIICHTGETVIETPHSLNVSAGQEVAFTCATEGNGSTIAWFFSTKFGIVSPGPNDSFTSEGTYSTRSFTASVAHNQSTVTCFVFSGGKTEGFTALLLVQGN